MRRRFGLWALVFLAYVTTAHATPPTHPTGLTVTTISCGAHPVVRLHWNTSTPGTNPIYWYLVYKWQGSAGYFTRDRCPSCPENDCTLQNNSDFGCDNYGCCSTQPNPIQLPASSICDANSCTWTTTEVFSGLWYYTVEAADTFFNFSQPPNPCPAGTIGGGGVCDGARCTPYPCYQCTYNGAGPCPVNAYCGPSGTCDDTSACRVVSATTTVPGATTTTTLQVGTCTTPDTSLLGGGGTVSGTTSGLSQQTGTCPAGSSTAPERVYQWVPSVSGSWTIQTCGSGTNFDTLLYLRNSPCASGTEVACNNDACTNGAGLPKASKITATLTQGQTYYIVVDGGALSPTEGNFQLNVAPTPTTTSTVTTTTTTTSTVTTTTTTTNASATTTTTTAPVGTWSKRFGNTGEDRGQSVASDGSGNVILGGKFQGSVDFGNGTRVSHGGADAVVAKYTSAGAWVWDKTFGGTNDDIVYGVAVDSSGNAVVVGQFWGSNVDFGDGVPVSSAGDRDIFVVKFASSDGHVLWKKTYGSTGADIGYAIAVDATGAVLVTGTFQGTVNFGGVTPGPPSTTNGQDALALKLNGSSGATVWAKNFPTGGTVQGFSIASDSSGNNGCTTGAPCVVIGGINFGYTNFGDGVFVPYQSYDIFVVKLAASGAYVWSKTFGSDGRDVVRGMAVASNGDVVLTGYFAATQASVPTLSFGGSCNAITSNTGVGGDGYLAKLAALGGACLWAKGFSGTPGAPANSGVGVATDASGNVFVTGVFSQTANFGGGSVTAGSSQDALVAKYTSTGTYSTAVHFPSSTTASDVFNNMAVDQATSKVVMTGAFQGVNVDFGSAVLSSIGNGDIFLLRLAP